MGGSKVDIFIHQSCQIDPLVKQTLWSKRSTGQIDPLVKKPLVNGTSGQRDPLVKRTLWSKEPLVKGTLWSKNLWSMRLWSKFLWSTGLWSKDPHLLFNYMMILLHMLLGGDKLTHEFPDGLNQESCMEAGTLPNNSSLACFFVLYLFNYLII